MVVSGALRIRFGVCCRGLDHGGMVDDVVVLIEGGVDITAMRGGTIKRK